VCRATFVQYRVACREFVGSGLSHRRSLIIRVSAYSFKRNDVTIEIGTIRDMTSEERDRFHRLCAQIEKETDHHKFLKLMEELNELMRRKEGRLERAPSPQKLGSSSESP
jgi:hypothetical protein